MFLLDTNVVSAMRRAHKADQRLANWAGQADSSEFYLSVISVLEIETGVLSIERRDSIQGGILRTWLDQQIMRGFRGRILPVDEPIARQCARLHVPDRRPERDALIAATALVHRFTVVTRNVADFAPMGVKVVNPWAL